MEQIPQRLGQPEIGVGVSARKAVVELHDEIEVTRLQIERFADGGTEKLEAADLETATERLGRDSMIFDLTNHD